MPKIKKNSVPYKTIGQLTKELNLIDKKTGQPQTHTLRYWESQFKQIRPTIKAGGRRYYNEENIQVIRLVKFLLKEKGLTIKGVRKVLDNKKLDAIDPNTDLGVYKSNLKTKKIIEEKIKKIASIIKQLKSNKNG